MDNLTLSLIISGQLQDADLLSFTERDWKFLIHKGRAQGVGSLIYWVLSKAGKLTFVPEPIRKSLRSQYSVTWMHNRAILSELDALAQLYSKAGIPIVVLKGACFARTIYPDIGLRPMGDLDILVPGARLNEAVQIAQSFEYTYLKPEISQGLRNLINHEVCLQKTTDRSIILELHKSLIADQSYVYAVPVSWFWEQTEPLSGITQGKFENLYMLTPTAQLLYAAAHAMLQHGESNTPLRWLYDLDLLIRVYSERIDWDLLLMQAERFEWSSALDTALSRVYEYFKTPIPDYVRISLSKGPDRHAKLIINKQDRISTPLLGEYHRLRSLSGYARLRLLVALLAPSPSYIQWRYKLKSYWAVPVYYLIRWWGILKDSLFTIRILALKRKKLHR